MLGVVTKDYGNCKCRMLSIVVDFMMLSDIYTVFYFELADDIYSIHVLCSDPYLYVFFLFIVDCNKRTVILNLLNLRVSKKLK